MRRLVWSPTFRRAFKRVAKRAPHLRPAIEDALESLQRDPFGPYLATHKLKGKLAGTWACSAGYDLRIVFEFVQSSDSAEDDIFLIEVGSHEEVY